MNAEKRALKGAVRPWHRVFLKDYYAKAFVN